MLVSLWILIIMRYTIYHQKQFDKHFPIQVQLQICSAIHKISANKAFIFTDGLIPWLFIVAFIHPTYMWIALIWGFPSQLSLWKSIYYLWRYKLNEVCNTPSLIYNLGILFNLMNTHIYPQISFHTWSNLFSIWLIMNICSKQVLSWYHSW